MAADSRDSKSLGSRRPRRLTCLDYSNQVSLISWAPMTGVMGHGWLMIFISLVQQHMLSSNAGSNCGMDAHVLRKWTGYMTREKQDKNKGEARQEHPVLFLSIVTKSVTKRSKHESKHEYHQPTMSHTCSHRRPIYKRNGELPICKYTRSQLELALLGNACWNVLTANEGPQVIQCPWKSIKLYNQIII